jgi:hypothetical protein
MFNNKDNFYSDIVKNYCLKVLPCCVAVISVHFPPSFSRNNGHKPNVLPPTRQNVKLGC